MTRARRGAEENGEAKHGDEDGIKSLDDDEPHVGSESSAEEHRLLNRSGTFQGRECDAYMNVEMHRQFQGKARVEETGERVSWRVSETVGIWGELITHERAWIDSIARK